MKLVFVTQVMDAGDAVLGFVPRWVRGLAAHCEQVLVIALEVGDLAGLPANVEVQELGRKGRLRRYLRYRALLRDAFGAGGFDRLLAHMVPRYATLADGPVRKAGGRTFLWYTHKGVDDRLRKAEIRVDKIFTASDKSLRLPTPKKLVTGHGIDLDHFALSGQRDPGKPAAGPKLLCVGRLTQAKDPMTTLRGLHALRQRGIAATCKWIGAGLVSRDSEFGQKVRRQAKELGLTDSVEWAGMVPYRDIPDEYAAADMLVSTSETGSVDKVVLEAMASGLPVVVSGEAYPPLWTDLGQGRDRLVFPKGDAEVLADRVEALWSLGGAERAELGAALREIVLKDHEVDRLMARLVHEMAGETAGAKGGETGGRGA